MKRRDFAKKLAELVAVGVATPTLMAKVFAAEVPFEETFSGKTLYGSGSTEIPWTVDRASKTIEYVGGGDQSTILELHRWLQELADDAMREDSQLDISDPNPSVRHTDHIIKLVNGYHIDSADARFLTEGSLLQGDGEMFSSIPGLY